MMWQNQWSVPPVPSRSPGVTMNQKIARQNVPL